MARRKKPAEHENHERWLVSYADFITLLFAFFVVMFATSQTDRGKAEQMQEAVRRALDKDQIVTAIAGILGGVPDDKGVGNAQWKGPGGSEKSTAPRHDGPKYVELLPSLEHVSKELEQEIKAGKMQVSMERRGMVISLQQSAFFPSGGDEIPDETFDTVAKVAEIIMGVPNQIRFEGHTDSRPLRPSARFRSNWDLSTARAIAVMELLVECCGLTRERVSVAGFAENAPTSDNATDQGRARNRRVDVVILNHAGLMDQPQALQSKVKPD